MGASQVATAMVSLMEKRITEGIDLVECFGGLRYFSGTMTELRKALKDIAENELEVNTKDGKKWPQSPQALGNKLTEAATNLREIGIVIERPENKASHTKDVILIKLADDGKPGTRPLESFPSSSPVGKWPNSRSNSA